MDPILDSKNSRDNILPIKYKDLWEFRNKLVDSFWKDDEIYLQQDVKDWENIGVDKQNFIGNILAFFATADDIVTENLVNRFWEEVQIPEAKGFYSFQIMNEHVHAVTYARLIDAYYRKDKKKRDDLFAAAKKHEYVKAKIDWMKNAIVSNKPFHVRLFMYGCVESIFFSSAFCAIYFICEGGKLKGLNKSNEFISRDETLHMEFAALIYKKYCINKLSDEEAHKIVDECVKIEDIFVNKCLEVPFIGMNAKKMCIYVRFIADIYLTLTGHKKLYNVTNPFPRMIIMNMYRKANFFEVNDTNYTRMISEYEDENDYVKIEKF